MKNKYKEGDVVLVENDGHYNLLKIDTVRGDVEKPLYDDIGLRVDLENNFDIGFPATDIGISHKKVREIESDSPLMQIANDESRFVIQ